MNTDNKQVLQCPQKQFSTHNSHLRPFSWKFFQRSVRSCAATPGVLLASLRTGENFGEKVHLPRDVNPGSPDGRCTFPSLQRSYWQHWASISGTISFTRVQGAWQAGCFSHDLRQQVTSYQTDHMEDWDNISKKAFKCLCISDPQGYCDRFWCILMFWNLQMEFWMAEVLIEGIKPFALLSGIVLRRCVWARCPCMKAPNSTSPVSVHHLEFWILSPRTFIWQLVCLQRVCFSLNPSGISWHFHTLSHARCHRTFFRCTFNNIFFSSVEIVGLENLPKVCSWRTGVAGV